MSTHPTALTPVQPEPGHGPEAQESPLAGSPNWPVTHLVSASLMLLVGICQLGPALFAGSRDVRWLALLLPVVLATLTARLAFEAIDAGTRRRGAAGHLLPAAIAAVLATLVTTGSALIVGSGWTAAGAAVSAVLTCGALLVAGAMRDLEIRLRMALRRVFFVGSETARRDLETELRRRSDASFVGAAPAASSADGAAFEQQVRTSQATVLVMDRDAMQVPALVEAASRLNLSGLPVRDLVGYYEAEFKKVPLAELNPTWFLFDIAPAHHRAVRRLCWRGLETALALVLLILSLPFLLVGWFAIRLTSPGPGLYRQQRVGKGGAHFTLLKLRTMTVADESADWAGSQDHRVTPIGRFLRRFRLDELPQLWNVVHGDLALVGPRPEQIPIVERLEREIPFYSARHSVRPGLTGWAQVNLGYAGSFEGTLSKLQRDLYYVKHSSIRLDCLILWLTIKAIVSDPR